MSEHSISTINRIVVGGVAAVVTLSAWTALKVNDLDKSSGIFAIRLEHISKSIESKYADTAGRLLEAHVTANTARIQAGWVRYNELRQSVKVLEDAISGKRN